MTNSLQTLDRRTIVFPEVSDCFEIRTETAGEPDQLQVALRFPLQLLTCDCPAGNRLSLRSIGKTDTGIPKAFFEGRLSQCRGCKMKHQCMQNPSAADHRKGKGRQVSFLLNSKRKPTYTDWMRHRVDSDKGKQIYGHRMSVVEPVFANIGTNKKLSRFSLRSKEKGQAQWQLYCLVHNIESLARNCNMAA